MRIETVVDFLLTRYAQVAFWIAVGATVALLVLPVIYLLARGQAIRRSADGRARRGRSTVLLVLLIAVVPLVVVSWGSVAGRWWLVRSGGILTPTVAHRIEIAVGVLIVVLYLFRGVEIDKSILPLQKPLYRAWKMKISVCKVAHLNSLKSRKIYHQPKH